MFRPASLLLSLALGLVACQAAAPSAAPEATPASPVPSATATPTATPVDVAALFLPQIVAATSARLEIDGAVEFGSQIGTIEGTLVYVGGDTDQVMTISLGGTPTTTASIHKAGAGYTKSGAGPWFRDASAPAAGKDVSSVLKSLKTLRDAGLESFDGQSVHRLELPAGTVLDPAAFGLTDPAMRSPRVELVFFATAEGRPVLMRATITWSQASGTTTIAVKMTADMRFAQIGGSLRVNAPAEVWSRFSSARFHYAMAYPGDWDVDATGKGFDRFASPADPFVLATRDKCTCTLTLNDLAKAEIAANKRSGFVLDSNVALTLGGQKARLVSMHGKIQGSPYVIYEALMVKGSYAYFVNWFSPKGHEAADLASFKAMLATFAIT